MLATKRAPPKRGLEVGGLRLANRKSASPSVPHAHGMYNPKLQSVKSLIKIRLALNGPIGTRCDRVTSLEQAKTRLRAVWERGMAWEELEESAPKTG